ncbi:MAG: hypothetical protein WD800_08465, partial [Dehalococcoidia bacterium]
MVTRSAPNTIRQAAHHAPSGRVAVVLGALTAIALFAVLFPWFPGGQTLDVGVAVAGDVTSPRDATYESEVLTERQRSEAADAIDDVLIYDTAIRDRQLAELDRILAAVDTERRDQTKSTSAKETAVQSIAGGDLSQRSAAVLVEASEPRWSDMQSEARDTLSRTLTGAIGPDEVDAARSRASGFLSPLLTAEETLALTGVLDPLVVPTLIVSEERTEALRAEARANTPPVRVTFAQGQVIVPAGATVDEAAYEAIRTLDIRTGSVTLPVVLAAAMVAGLSGAGFAGHLWVARPRSLRGVRRLSLLVLTLLTPAVTAKFAFPLILPDHDNLYLALALPLAAGPIVAAVLLDVSSGVICAVVLAAVVGFLSVAVPNAGGGSAATELDSLRLVMAAAAASLAGIYVASRAERLQGYLGAGLAVAIASASAALAILLLGTTREVEAVLWIAGTSLAGGMLVAVISVGAFVLLSRPFGIITRVELMELVQLNHPLLRRLQDEAPGTFQHSMLVGSLA